MTDLKDRWIFKPDLRRSVIDIGNGMIPVPAANVTDTPKRWHYASLEWEPIINGFLSWLLEEVAWNGDDQQIAHAQQQIMEYIIGMPEFPCDDIEICLPNSPTIQQINTNIASVETNVSTNATNIINNTTTINAITNNTPQNVIQPPPQLTVPDNMCSAAWYIESQLYDLIMQWRADVQTITLSEFLYSLLGLGGWNDSLLVLGWNWFTSNFTNPNFVTNVDAARDYVREIIYCAEMDYQQVIDDINASSDILPVAKGAYIQVWRAATEGQRLTWSAVGQLSSVGDCGDYSCQPTGLVVFDFVGDYVPDGSESAIYDNVNYWTLQAGSIDPVNGLTSTGTGYNNAALRSWGATMRQYRAYQRKISGITANAYIYWDGNQAVTHGSDSGTTFHWSSWYPIKSDNSLVTFNELGVTILSGQIKWLQIRD